MKVKYASQVFSFRVASAFAWASRVESSSLFRVGRDASRIILFLDKLFDSVNGSFLTPGKPLRSALTPTSKHGEFWQVLNVLSTMVFVDKENPAKISRVPSIKNWMITIRGLQLIWKNLQVDQVKFLVLRNVNQDPPEIFFGSIRSHGFRNVNPTCFGFVGAYKILLVNNLLQSYLKWSNCEDDATEGALASFQDLLGIDKQTQLLSPIDYPHFDVNLTEDGNTLQISNYCGWVLKQMKKNDSLFTL